MLAELTHPDLWARDMLMLAARAMLGGSSIVHGLQKLRALASFSQRMGIPRPLAWCVGCAQALAGLGVLAWVLPALCLAVLSAISCTAVLIVALRHRAPFFAPGVGGWDYPLMHLAAALALLGSSTSFLPQLLH